MPLTRKFLKGLGIEGEEVEKIIKEHTDTIDGLKDDIDNLKADAENHKAVEKELNELKEQLNKGNSYKEKYETVKKEYEEYKANIDSEKAHHKRAEAYKAMLKESGISEKRIESVLKLAKVDGLIDKIEFDEEGKVKDSDSVKKSINSAYSEYIENIKEKGADTPKPPANNGGGRLSKAEIYAKDEKGRYKLSTEERHKALAENMSTGNEA